MAWTSPRTYVAGEVITASILNTDHRDNLKAIGDPWTAYTPTWTGTGFAIGNGTITGAWLSAGKLTLFRFIATIGTTTTVGTGAYSIGLPSTAITTNIPVGDLTVFNGSARQRNMYANTTTTAAAQDESGAFVTGAAPFALVSTNTLKGVGFYEAA